MKRWGWAALAVLLGGCAAFSGASAPDTAARDAHQAELKACAAYDLLPAEKHKPAADKLCRQVRLECTEPGAGGAP